MKQKLSDSIDDYYSYARSMNLSAPTMKGVRATLTPLLKNVGDIYVTSISGNHIAQFMLKAAETRQPSSLVNTHSILTRFFNWAVQTGRVQSYKNPMNGRRPPKTMKRERLKIPLHRWIEMLSIAESQDPRDRALVATGLYTLLRDGELASIRMRDVDLNTGSIKATIHKSNFEDTLAISCDLDTELRRWMKHYQKIIGPLQPDYLLFPTLIRALGPRDGGKFEKAKILGYNPYKPITRMANIVTPVIGALGYPLRDEHGHSLQEGMHTLRRSGARAYYDLWIGQGRADSIRTVQTMMHHKNSDQTEEYIGLSLDRATRDDLLRGNVIFGLDALTKIGVDDGATEGYNDGQGVRQLREA